MPVEGAEVDPENGKDIITTLDTYMQDVTENALMKKLVSNRSLHGTVIIMETETGKIKAIANLGKMPDGSVTENLNYGIGKRTEPGSIFKLVTLLALLEDKHVEIESPVDCEGGAKYFYGLRIQDSHLGLGTISVKDAFARSSNVAFAKLADRYYHNQPDEFLKHIHRFRLDTLTGIDIIASSGRPVFYKPSSKYWHATSIPFMAHGYGQLVTPLHMLMVYNAVANNGKMMKPYLVNEIRDYGVTVRTFEPQVLVNKICSDATLKQALECMRAVVDSPEGTGHKFLYDRNYSIAGKTGTAVSALDNKGYNKGNKIYQSSFIGFFPANKPRYTMAVVIQNSNESIRYYGAEVAGDVFKEISDQVFSHFISNVPVQLVRSKDSLSQKFCGLKSDMTTILGHMKIQGKDSAGQAKWAGMEVRNSAAVLKPARPMETNKKATPSVVGLGLTDALYVLENKGFRTAISGRGRVVSQSIPAGTAFNKGQKITIYLN
jgi:cell division protein FtsI (penicillin-binding protein 3)